MQGYIIVGETGNKQVNDEKKYHMVVYYKIDNNKCKALVDNSWELIWVMKGKSIWVGGIKLSLE